MPRKRKVSKRRLARLEDLFPDAPLKVIETGSDELDARAGLHCPTCQDEYTRLGAGTGACLTTDGTRRKT